MAVSRGRFSEDAIAPPRGGPGGKVFYVNYNAAGHARNVDREWYGNDSIITFDTLQEAIDACVDYRGDIIYVARAYMSISTPVLFNKIGISVIAQSWGMDPRTQGEYFCIDNSGTTEAAAIISEPCYIYGLGFHTNWITAGSHEVAMGDGTGAGPHGTYLDHCRFTSWGTAVDYGIQFRASNNCVIDHCSFEGELSGTRFVGGINFWTTATNNPINNQVRNCTFNYCTNSIVHTASVNHQGFIYGPGNITSETGTKFLNSAGGLGSGIICGNYFCTAEGTATYDLSVANLETAGIMCTGNEYSTEGPGPT